MIKIQAGNKLNNPVIEYMDMEDQTLDLSHLPQGVVTVDIPPWRDRSVGDTVICHFGGRSFSLIPHDTITSVYFQFSADVIAPGNNDVWYTISDIAGNTATSYTVHVKVIKSGGSTGVPDIYPIPFVPQATGGVIDLAGLYGDIMVSCYPRGNASAGDTLRLHFGDIIIEKVLTFPVLMTDVCVVPKGQVIHGDYSVWYEVLKNNTQIGYSQSIIIRCEEDTQVFAPRFPQAINGVIDLTGEFTHVEMDIPHFDAAEYGGVINCYIGGHETTTVIENASADVVARASFPKDVLFAGTLKARYQVVLDDEYTIDSPSIEITFSEGGVTPSDPFLEQVWEKLSAGVPFRIKVGVTGWGLSPNRENGWVLAGPGIDNIWHPQVVPNLERTIHITNQNRQTRWATSHNISSLIADMDYSSISANKMYDCFQISTNNAEQKYINISCVTNDGSMYGLVHALISSTSFGQETHFLECNGSYYDIGYSDFHFEFLF